MLAWYINSAGIGDKAYIDLNTFAAPSFIQLSADSATDNWIFSLNSVGFYNAKDGASGNSYFEINKPSDLYRFGDMDGSNTGTTLILNDAVQLSRITSASGNRLFLDALNGLYQMGDIDGFGNSSYAEINDATQFAQIILGTNPCLILDAPNADYLMGDINGVGNSTLINAFDSASSCRMTAGNVLLAQLDLDHLNSNFEIILNGVRRLLLDEANNRYQIGDLGVTTNNGGIIDLDDAASMLSFGNTANNLGITINGVAGFTGVVAPVNTITVNNGIVTNVA